MKITRLSFFNWCSYFGEHNIDFDTEEGSAFVFFGTQGRGKSTLVDAIEWVLFGEVFDSIDDGEREVLRQCRPIIDSSFYNGEKKDFALPLLIDKAYWNGEYRTWVSLYFEHEGKSGHLQRTAYSKVEGIPENDDEMEIEVSLILGEDEVKIQGSIDEIRDDFTVKPKIEEIIPRKISRFFFVRGDNVRELTGLIFGIGNDKRLLDQVDSVVGIPAITKLIFFK